MALTSKALASLPTGWTSARALGMGNAYTAVVSNADAIFYNPAGLMKVEGVHWTIIDPRVGIDNPQNVTLAKSLSSAGSDPSSLINSLYGNQIWVGGGTKSAITVPYFGVAGYANTEGGALATDPADPSLLMNYYFDYGAAVGAALELVPSVFGLGLTGRYVNRTGYVGTIGSATLAQANTTALSDQLKNRGSAVAVDFGALLTLPGPISPSLSFVYRDIGNTIFSHDQGLAAPQSVLAEMIVGASLTLKVPLITITPSLDYRYVGWSNVPTGENVNAGLEVSLPLIDLRGGVSQGYYTAGVGLDLGMIRADVATWAVEMGAYPGQAVDRRYLAQVTIELGFDPFKFLGGFGGSGSGGSGSSRHLKQRR